MTTVKYEVVVEMRHGGVVLHKRFASKDDAETFSKAISGRRKPTGFLTLVDVYDSNGKHYSNYEIKPFLIKNLFVSDLNDKDNDESKGKSKSKKY